MLIVLVIFQTLKYPNKRKNNIGTHKYLKINTYVETSKAECQLLNAVWWQTHSVMNNVVASWSNCALIN